MQLKYSTYFRHGNSNAVTNSDALGKHNRVANDDDNVEHDDDRAWQQNSRPFGQNLPADNCGTRNSRSIHIRGHSYHNLPGKFDDISQFTPNEKRMREPSALRDATDCIIS